MSGQWLIKTLLVVMISIAGIFMLRSSDGDKSLAVRRIATLLFMLFAIIAVLQPLLVSRIAFYLGIGRGADLVLYILTVAFFANLVTNYRRTIYLEQKNTDIARSIALNSVQYPEGRHPEA
ncbi:hypothetical protein BM477_02250 [Boudabousia marimammalium]|uniref:DUF2304 domain-containing protein n=1 Tax=Boudabousia marimammalium TaxID=156892 RepID=A0A1Q5PS19_9ACTO|nr:hypothetical protein BM477_02250 [Boudabousia marimammalium]